MKIYRRLLIGVFYAFTCLLILNACNSSSKTEWSNYTYEDLSFEARFPGKPVENKQSFDSGEGIVNITMLGVESSESAYMVARSEYPKGNVTGIDEMLSGAINGAANNIGGEIISSRDVTVGKYPAKEAKISFKEGSAMNYMKIILVDNSLYQLQALGNDDDDLRVNAAKFFDAFKLL